MRGYLKELDVVGVQSVGGRYIRTLYNNRLRTNRLPEWEFRPNNGPRASDKGADGQVQT